MRHYKRILGLLLTLTLMFSMSAVNAADTAVMTDLEKAEFLNTLEILLGDGTGFNLEGQLKRSEAATFIVRMMGKDALVTQHPQNYLQGKFSDVSDTDWFAPYVGYCVQEGIVAGFDDNTFKPEAFVSEKAFLKMLMTAMGYVYDEDFTWAEVYSYAYALNVVSDETYTSKVSDNYSYTRGNVVESLFATLKAFKKGSNERMIQSFVDAEVVSEAQAVVAGILDDSVDTAIEDVEVFDPTAIILTFNEPLKQLEVAEVLVYEKNNTDVVLEVDEIIANSSQTVFTVIFKESQEADKSYGILMDGVIDSYGNKSDMLSENFKGFRPEVLQSDFFKISKVTPENSKTFYLYFTHPVNANMTQPSLYTIQQGATVISSVDNNDISVTLLSSDQSAVAITLDNNTFEEDQEYDVIVSGLATSQYGVTLNDGEGDHIVFSAINKDEEPLELLLVNGPNQSSIDLYFNKEVNKIIAEQIFSYYLTTTDDIPIPISKATLTEDGDTVRLTVNYVLKDDTEYNLLINNINDVSMNESITLTAYAFTNNFSSISDVTAQSVIALDAGTIAVKLSKPLDEDSARTVSNYRIDGIGTTYSTVPVAAYYDHDVDPLMLKLYLASNKDMSTGKQYELRMLSGLKDEGGLSQSTSLDYAFTNTQSGTDVYIEEATVVGSTAIRVTFNKEIALDVPNVLNTNYELSYVVDGATYKKIPVTANYIDALTMIVHFDSLDSLIDYTITFDSLVNYAGEETINNGKYSEDVDWN